MPFPFGVLMAISLASFSGLMVACEISLLLVEQPEINSKRETINNTSFFIDLTRPLLNFYRCIHRQLIIIVNIFLINYFDYFLKIIFYFHFYFWFGCHMMINIGI